MPFAEIELISCELLPSVRITSSEAVVSTRMRLASRLPRFLSSTLKYPLSPLLISEMLLGVILNIGSALVEPSLDITAGIFTVALALPMVSPVPVS